MRLPTWIQTVVLLGFCSSAQSAVITTESKRNNGTQVLATIHYDDSVLGTASASFGGIQWPTIPLQAGTTENFDFDISISANGVLPQFFFWRLDPSFQLQDPPIELRFSNFVLAEHGTSAGGTAAAGTGLGDFVVNGRVNFTPGHFLSISPDPACASLSCMVPGADSATVSYAFSIGVPEPELYLMVLLGLGVMAVIRSYSRTPS